MRFVRALHEQLIARYLFRQRTKKIEDAADARDSAKRRGVFVYTLDVIGLEAQPNALIQCSAPHIFFRYNSCHLQ